MCVPGHALRDVYACGTRVTEACLPSLVELTLLEDLWLKRNPSIDPCCAVVLELQRRRPRANVKIA